MGLRSLLVAGALSAVSLWNGLAHATILTFDISDSTLADPPYVGGFPEGYGTGFSFPFSPLNGYGNNVAGPTGMNVNGTTSFSYGVGTEGYTPDVTAEYGPGGFISGAPVLWREGYGDLTNVLEQGGAWNTLSVDLVAASGLDVLLYGFDLGGYQGDITITGVEVFDGMPFPFIFPTNQIFSDYGIANSGVTVPGPGGGALSYAFSTPLRSNRIVIRISTTEPISLADQHDLIGIDNIRFGQDRALTPVPEPATATLLALGLGSLGLVQARRRKANRPQA